MPIPPGIFFHAIEGPRLQAIEGQEETGKAAGCQPSGSPDDCHARQDSPPPRRRQLRRSSDVRTRFSQASAAQAPMMKTTKAAVTRVASAPLESKTGQRPDAGNSQSGPQRLDETHA